MKGKVPGRLSGGSLVAVALVLAASLFVRPNVLSVDYAIIGTGLCACAAAMAMLTDRGSSRTVPLAYVIVVVVLGLAYLWLAVNAALFAPDTVAVIAKGFTTTVLTAGFVGPVLADAERRRLIARGFVGLVMAICGSYVVTLGAWLIAGSGSVEMMSFQMSPTGGMATVHFPFTVTYGAQNIGGVTLPRLTGMGREPGWMSLYAGLAFLIWRRVSRTRPMGYVLLLVGILGPLSTAGFGAFAVVLVLAWFSRRPRTKDMFVHYLAFLLKCAVLVWAVGLAVYAPVLGFAAKGDINQESLDDRSSAISDGLEAITSSPLGGAGEGEQSSITLLAAIAPFGVPYFLVILAALLLPRTVHPAKHRTTAPIALITITLLLSQPPGDSTFVFVLAGLVYCISLSDMERSKHLPEARPAPVHRPR